MPPIIPKASIPRLPYLRLALGGDYVASVHAACSVGVAPLAVCCNTADRELLAELLPEKGKAVIVGHLWDLHDLAQAIATGAPRKGGGWATGVTETMSNPVAFTDLVLVNFTALSRMAADSIGRDVEVFDDGAARPRIPSSQQPASQLFGAGGVWESTRLNLSRILADLMALPLNIIATYHVQTAEPDRGEPGERSLSAVGWGKRQSGDPWTACGLVTADDEKEHGYVIRFQAARNDFQKAPPSWPNTWASALAELADQIFQPVAVEQDPAAQPE